MRPVTKPGPCGDALCPTSRIPAAGRSEDQATAPPCLGGSLRACPILASPLPKWRVVVRRFGRWSVSGPVDPAAPLDAVFPRLRAPRPRHRASALWAFWPRTLLHVRTSLSAPSSKPLPTERGTSASAVGRPSRTMRSVREGATESRAMDKRAGACGLRGHQETDPLTQSLIIRNLTSFA